MDGHHRVIIITINTTARSTRGAPTLSSGHTERPSVKHYTFLNTFNPHYYHHHQPHFINKETGPERLSHLPKVTQPQSVGLAS